VIGSRYIPFSTALRAGTHTERRLRRGRSSRGVAIVLVLQLLRRLPTALHDFKFASILVLTLAHAGALYAPESAAADAISEPQMKAAFIYNFSKFVEWPPERFSNPDDPIVVGVLGRSDVFRELTLIVQNRKANGRPLTVRQVESAADTLPIHVLFVPSNERSRLAALKGSLQGGILLVADADSCTVSQSSICFLMEGDRLRFSIDAEAAARAEVKISSHLKKLAVGATP
jgi:hypothetical protein